MELKTDYLISTPAIDSTEPQSILIVDDNPRNLGVLSNYLKGSGYRILVARSGESALRKAKYVSPDIILLDVIMNGIDGFETCRQLKMDERTQDIPIIFMTALSSPEDKVRGFQVGAVDYITKPLQYQEVVARVNTHLHLRTLHENLKNQNEQLQKTTDDLMQANEHLSKQALQTQISSQVARQITSILDLDDLLQNVVKLIQQQFGYYFVGVWLLDTPKQQIILTAQAVTGKRQLDLNYAIPVDRSDSAVAWVCETGTHYLVNDVENDSKYFAVDLLVDTKTELVLPLQISENAMGALDILSLEEDAFDDTDLVVLQTLADQISIAIRNAQLYKAEQRRRQLAESLEHTGRVLSSNLNLHLLSERILQELAGVVPYERGAVLLRRGDEVYSIAKYGYPAGEEKRQIHVHISDGDVFLRMVETERPVLIDDVLADPGWQQMAWLPVNHSWLGVPLITKNKVIGMISLTRLDIAAFSEEDATLVLAFSSQAAIALENADLYDQINQLNAELEQKVVQRTQELNKANQLLERLDRTKTDFINVTSHELRTPLSIIQGYSQILQNIPAIVDDPSNEELIVGISEGAERLQQIVNTMLDVVRIETQALEIHVKQITITDIIELVRMKFMTALQERQLTLTTSGLEKLPAVFADPDLLFKVFNNLIVNAIKYTPDRGKISVIGQQITSSDSDEEEKIKITIRDTGIGLNPEHHILIFKKFYQTGKVAFHSTGETKFKGGGPGLGLAIVKGIVLAHRGQVWVESAGYNEETYPGSRFQVVLPVNN